MHVVVVGAGIVGASIAYHLSLQGAKVTVIDREGPASHASRGTFAWINATWAKQPRAYHAFNQDGLLGWHRLQSDLGIPVRWGGSLEWFETDTRQARLAEQIAEQVDWGEPAEMIGPEALRELEGKVDFTGVEQAAYSPNDGAVDPVLATWRNDAKPAASAAARLAAKIPGSGVASGAVIRLVNSTCLPKS